MPVTIVVSEVYKSYGSDHAAEGVSFTAGAGQFFGILGANGAGKTVILDRGTSVRSAVRRAATVTIVGPSSSRRFPGRCSAGTTSEHAPARPPKETIMELSVLIVLMGLLILPAAVAIPLMRDRTERPVGDASELRRRSRW